MEYAERPSPGGPPVAVNPIRYDNPEFQPYRQTERQTLDHMDHAGHHLTSNIPVPQTPGELFMYVSVIPLVE